MAARALLLPRALPVRARRLIVPLKVAERVGACDVICATHHVKRTTPDAYVLASVSSLASSLISARAAAAKRSEAH